jgi:hypothetical protein
VCVCVCPHVLVSLASIRSRDIGSVKASWVRITASETSCIFHRTFSARNFIESNGKMKRQRVRGRTKKIARSLDRRWGAGEGLILADSDVVRGNGRGGRE